MKITNRVYIMIDRCHLVFKYDDHKTLLYKQVVLWTDVTLTYGTMLPHMRHVDFIVIKYIFVTVFITIRLLFDDTFDPWPLFL